MIFKDNTVFSWRVQGRVSCAKEPLSTAPNQQLQWNQRLRGGASCCCLQIGEDNTMNTGPVSISRAVSLCSLTLLPLYSIQFPWQRAECCWRSSSRISWSNFIRYSISLQTKQARKTQEARSVWTADGDVMWLWRQDGAVTESAPEAWRVCKNTNLMRVSSCESHLLTFNPELFCLVKQRKICPQQTVTICDIILKGHRYFLSLWKKGNTLKSDLSWCTVMLIVSSCLCKLCYRHLEHTEGSFKEEVHSKSKHVFLLPVVLILLGDDVVVSVSV